MAKIVTSGGQTITLEEVDGFYVLSLIDPHGEPLAQIDMTPKEYFHLSDELGWEQMTTRK